MVLSDEKIISLNNFVVKTKSLPQTTNPYIRFNDVMNLIKSHFLQEKDLWDIDENLNENMNLDDLLNLMESEKYKENLEESREILNYLLPYFLNI